MPVVIAPLGPTHVTALRSMLSRDSSHNMYLLGLMEEYGVVSGLRAPFTFHGRFVDDELTAALFVGGTGGLMVPSASSPAHIGDILKKLASNTTVNSVAGEQTVVEAIVRHFNLTPSFSKAQKLFSVTPNDLGPFTNPMLRPATDADLLQLLPMAAACVKELMNRDPLVEDPAGFKLRVRQRVRSQRTYVLEDNGRLVFKLDVGSRSQFGAELEGLYTEPDARGRGHATLCLGQISRFLMSSLPRLTVRVDDEQSHVATIARKVGYLQGRAQRLLWV